MILQSLGLDYYTSNYRFSSVKGDPKSLQESYKTVKGMSFSNLEDLNNKLSVLEKKGEKSSLLLNINEQPKDIMELFQKVSGGKYLTFLQNNVDGIMVGRNLEEASGGNGFMESTGVSVDGAAAKKITDGKMSKIIGIDTFNEAFQSVETQTTADVVFTKQSQAVSVFVNELKQAYFISKGDSKDTQGVYEFMQTAITDVESYLDSGKSLSFVPASEQGVFKTALTMMKDSITSHIADTYGASSGSIKWDWKA
ncbi:MAG: hypothetical protein WCH76_05480 [Candidatus Riflemargulisbacteria bacterium]